jgi:DNA-binding NtrC family response regulator
MAAERILILEDQEQVRASLADSLQSAGYRVEAHAEAEGAREALRHRPVDLLVVDIQLAAADRGGLDFLRAVRAFDPGLPAVVVSGRDTRDNVFEAGRLGAQAFLSKGSFGEAELLAAVEEALRHFENGGAPDAPGSALERMLGQSRSMRRLKAQIRRFAPLDMPVLISGATGTGKELAAHALHECAPERCGRPLTVVNCGAIPETLIESHLFGHKRGSFTGAVQDAAGLIRQAAGSTLFLDEVGELSPAAQQRLLRFLEDGLVRSVGDTREERVCTRVVAATHRDLGEAVRRGHFREDLFYRLNVLPLVLPPLRERPEDLPLLADYFLREAARQNGLPARRLAANAHTVLATHDWPGNIRELRNLMGRLAALCDGGEITVHDVEREAPVALPLPVHPSPPLPQDTALPVGTSSASSSRGPEAWPEAVPDFPRTVAEIRHLKDFRHEVQRAYVQHAIRLCGGNVTKAAQRLGVDRTSVYGYLGDGAGHPAS